MSHDKFGVFKKLTDLVERIAFEMQVQAIEISNNTNQSIVYRHLDVRATIYAMCFTTMLIRDNQIKDDFHNYYFMSANKSREFIRILKQLIPLHYKEYYTSYNDYVDSKNGMRISSTIVNLVICNSVEYETGTGILASAEIYALFTGQFISIIETVGMLSKLYDFDLL